MAIAAFNRFWFFSDNGLSDRYFFVFTSQNYSLVSIALPVKKFPGIKLREHCQIGIYSVEIILQPNFAAQVEFFGIFQIG